MCKGHGKEGREDALPVKEGRQERNFMRDQDGFLGFLLQVQWNFKLERRISDDSLAFSKDEGVCILLKYLKNTGSTLKRLKH